MTSAPRVWWHADGIVALRFEGHIDEAAVESLGQELQAFLGTARPRGAVFDTLGVTTVNPNVTLVGKTFLGVLIKRGCDKAGCASNAPLVRMLGSSIALAAGMRIKFVQTYDEAVLAVIDLIARGSR